MKRSSALRLTLMGAATAGSLSACDGGITHPGTYASVAACVEAGNGSRACTAARDAAYAAHEAGAPRFPSRDACVADLRVAECVATQTRNADGTVVTLFMPAMAGFSVNRAVASSSPSQGSGGSTGAHGRWGGSSSSSSAPAARAAPPNVHTTTIARSGFGSSSAFHGGAGG